MEKTITWNDDMSVNVKEIDDQHKEFIKIISDLFLALNKLEIDTELENIVDRLVSYASLHFETEEKYFDKFNYELKDEHKKKHGELKNKAIDLQKRFKTENIGILTEFTEFLIDWLVDHLENDDKKYTKCFNDNGLF
jgi:hemerythrin-like metal-binding protein